ncbi:hypothetical protein MMC30_007377 [Trapelia coarctata]|nr:hypothetical protein [Trapelia coarctata]
MPSQLLRLQDCATPQVGEGVAELVEVLEIFDADELLVFDLVDEGEAVFDTDELLVFDLVDEGEVVFDTNELLVFDLVEEAEANTPISPT